MAYTDNPACMTVCMNLTLGTDDGVGADQTNTVGCRIYHATVAGGGASAAATHCPHASASGGAQCGPSYCEVYCQLFESACKGTNSPYTATYTCMNACKYFDNSTGNYTTTSGANIFCKIYHATAALSAPATHCPHASPSGDGPCGSKCDNFCSFNAKACTGTLAQYPPDNSNCMSFCKSIPDGNFRDTAGNTKDCRIYHTIVGGIPMLLELLFIVLMVLTLVEMPVELGVMSIVT